MLDLRDVIRNPHNYTVDGKPLLSARLVLAPESPL